MYQIDNPLASCLSKNWIFYYGEKNFNSGRIIESWWGF
jgi:hypothetical protein